MGHQPGISPDQFCLYQLRSQLSISRTESSNFGSSAGEISIGSRITSHFNKNLIEFNKILDNQLEQRLSPLYNKVDTLLGKVEELIIKKEEKFDSDGLSIEFKVPDKLESIEKKIEIIHQATEKLNKLMNHEIESKKNYLNEQKILKSEKTNEDQLLYMDTTKLESEICSLSNRINLIVDYCKIGMPSQEKNEVKLQLADQQKISTNFKLLTDNIKTKFDLKPFEKLLEDLQHTFKTFEKEFITKTILMQELTINSINDQSKSHNQLISEIHTIAKKTQSIKSLEWNYDGLFKELLDSFES